MNERGALTVQLLGGFRIAEGDVPLKPFHASLRLQSLLAYLLLTRGTPLARTYMAGVFWPDLQESRAHANLRKALLELRRALPEADRFLRIDHATVEWHPDAAVWVDVDTFSRLLDGDAGPAALEQAVGLYRGDLLPHCYDDWIVPYREGLRTRFVEALEDLVSAKEARRDYGAAIHFASRLLEQDPLREATYRDLMRLHALTGNRTGALRVYHACADILQRELNVSPNPTIQEAYTHLLQLEGQPGPPPPAALPIVGRHTEWARLLALWRTASAGSPQVAVIGGEAGIGKTRLGEEFVAWAAQQGIATARTRCYAAERGLAYMPVTDLLRSRPLPSLPGMWKQEIVRLLPEVAANDPTLGPPGPLTETWQRQRFLEALARAMLADQPLLVFIDDLQWADPESLEWFHYLTRYDEGARLLIVATIRPEELNPGHSLHRLLDSWRDKHLLHMLDLPPLNREDTGQLAGALIGTPLTEARVDRLFTETEGNPFFIVEMARAGLLEDTPGGVLPAGIHNVIKARLDRLSSEAREIAGMAAVIGRSFTFDLLIRVHGTEEADVLRHLDELWLRRIVREHGEDAYDFTHDKVREVAYLSIGAPARRRIHRRVAETLEAVHSEDLDKASGQIARHFELGGSPDRAGEYYTRAARAARRDYALEAAIGYYRRAIQLEADARGILLILEVGEVLQLAGRWDDAEATYRGALDGAALVEDARLTAHLGTALADVLQQKGHYGDALQWLDRAEAVYRAPEDEVGLARVNEIRGVVYYEQGEFARALASHDAVLRLAERLGDPGLMTRALRAVGNTSFALGDIDRALSCHRRILEIAEETGALAEQAHALNNIGNVHLVRGEHARAIEHYERSLELASRIGARRTVTVATGNIGAAAVWMGDYLRGLEYCRRQYELAKALGDVRSANLGLLYMGWSYEAYGRYRDAEACYRAFARSAADGGNAHGTYAALMSLGRCRLAQGRPDEAARALPGPPGTQALLMAFFACEDAYARAKLRWLAGADGDAQALAEHAAEVAETAHRRPIEFASRLLAVLAEGRRLHGQDGSHPPMLERELRQLMETWTAPAEHAAISYELWRASGSTEDRERAAELYAGVYVTLPCLESRERYRTLTGRDLPPLPDLPPLVEDIDPSPVDLDALLTEVKPAIGATG